MLVLKSFGRVVKCTAPLLALLAMASCAETNEPDPVMGNTNWLQACDTDADCTGGLTCECGVCTRVCEASADCDGLTGAVCDSESAAHSAACGPSSTVALCLAAAQSDAGADAGDTDSGSGSDAGGDGDSGSDGGPVACEGPNPAGCTANSCPTGQRCDTTTDECLSSACSCDTQNGVWACTPDCGGGTCVVIEPVDCDGNLTFADLALEQIVRAAIERPSGDIVRADVIDLTDLNNEGMDGDVTSLEGIQCLTGLTSLTIGSGHITDLTPLTALESLRFLALSDHPELTDISPLAQLAGLQGVFITDTLVEDVSPLAGLTSAVEIALEGNRVRDVRPLQGLDSLDLLWLSGNPLDCTLNADAITSLEDGGVDVDAPQCD